MLKTHQILHRLRARLRGNHSLARDETAQNSRVLHSKTGAPQRSVQNAKLAFEFLEDRTLLAAGGVTVIAHGAQFAGTTIPDWVVSMGQAILDRADGASTTRSSGSMFQHDPATGFWSPVAASIWNNNNDPDEDVVLLYNWADESDQFQNGWLEAAADHLFASLFAENDNLAGGLAGARFVDLALEAGGGGGLLDLHLIGHSRGAVINSFVSERFDHYLEDLTIDQVTTLDGHPASLMDDRGYDSGNPGNSRIFTYDNVRFADNYFQSDGSYEPILLDFDGVTANGAYNFQIPSAVLQNGGSGMEHSDVHSWYYGTITAPFAAGYAGFSGAGRNNDGDVAFPEAWWGASGVPARTATGFAYSDIAGSSRAGLPTTGAKIDAGVVASLFNGDFAYVGSSNSLLPGWERHGGGGSAARAGAEAYVQLTASAPFRRHNVSLVDRNAVAVEFDYWINDNDGTAPDDELQVLLNGNVVDVISLADLTPSFVQNRRATLAVDVTLVGAVEFRIRDANGDGFESAVRIDNIEIVSEVPPPDADFDADGIVDGTDFLAWQRNVGTYIFAEHATGDADFDGNVLNDDLASWQANYGATTTALARSTGVSRDAVAERALAHDIALESIADSTGLAFSAGGAIASVAPPNSSSPLRNFSVSSRRRSSGVDSASSTGISATGSPSCCVQRIATSSCLAPSFTYSVTPDTGNGSPPARTLRNRTAATSFSAMNASASIDSTVSIESLL